jgi:protein gp37
VTTIEWCDVVWNPIVGCSRVSAGCEHCYAERVAHRGMSAQHRGLTVMGKKGPRWTGEVRFLPERLAEPLSWRKPRRVFVNSMSDLFHERVSDEQIAAVFGVMAATPQHAYQILTKRPERARDFMRWIVGQDLAIEDLDGCTPGLLHANAAALAEEARVGGRQRLHMESCADPSGPWPLPNVWLGVSVEDQRAADERIPLLLGTPAARRWVSYEPALGPIDFREWTDPYAQRQCLARYGRWGTCVDCPCTSDGVRPELCVNTERYDHHLSETSLHPRLDWIVVGGESGPGARPFDIAWARSTIEQCRSAGVPVFVKQLGAMPRWSDTPPPQWSERIVDRKGGDPSEWPADLRVREVPYDVEIEAPTPLAIQDGEVPQGQRVEDADPDSCAHESRAGELSRYPGARTCTLAPWQHGAVVTRCATCPWRPL